MQGMDRVVSAAPAMANTVVKARCTYGMISFKGTLFFNIP